MSDGQDFVDYYEILQVDYDCDARALERSYHFLAKMYHPDNGDTADIDKFTAVIEAYKSLRNPQNRAEYDLVYLEKIGQPKDRFSSNIDVGVDERTAIGDAEIHAKILFQLYKKRRDRASDAGVVGWLLQESLGCSDDLFEFHVWYLKSKGLIEMTEQGTLAITIVGVDHVISTSRTALKEKLRIVHSDTPE